jgi:phosphosulfolactate synthase
MTDPTIEGYLAALDAAALPPRTSPFDPGYDATTLEGHLEQSAHLMETLKISMSCWLIADEAVTRRKLRAAADHGVATVAGGGPFEIAVDRGVFDEYLELCAALTFVRIECARGFTDPSLDPVALCRRASAAGLETQFEVGKKHSGQFTEAGLDELISEGRSWLDAGAVTIVVEAREDAAGVGLFDASGELDRGAAERIVDELGIDNVVFEAPTKRSQFALLSHFGSDTHLGNVRLEELLRVETYRRRLHGDSYVPVKDQDA